MGCADLDPRGDLWISRTDDSVLVRCNDTNETWFLTCQDDVWVGEVGNCTTGEKIKINKRRKCINIVIVKRHRIQGSVTLFIYCADRHFSDAPKQRVGSGTFHKGKMAAWPSPPYQDHSRLKISLCVLILNYDISNKCYENVRRPELCLFD